jgi:hypothetical protein
MTTIDLQVPHVIWWKDPALRNLYLVMPVLMLAATINGYDGSLLNGLQTMDWGIDFGNPSGSRLGLFTAIMNLGGFSALPFGVYTIIL